MIKGFLQTTKTPSLFNNGTMALLLDYEDYTERALLSFFCLLVVAQKVMREHGESFVLFIFLRHATWSMISFIFLRLLVPLWAPIFHFYSLLLKSYLLLRALGNCTKISFCDQKRFSLSSWLWSQTINLNVLFNARRHFIAYGTRISSWFKHLKHNNPQQF